MDEHNNPGAGPDSGRAGYPSRETGSGDPGSSGDMGNSDSATRRMDLPQGASPPPAYGAQPPAYSGQPPAYTGPPPAHGGQPAQTQFLPPQPPAGGYQPPPAGSYQPPPANTYQAPPATYVQPGSYSGYNAQSPVPGAMNSLNSFAANPVVKDWTIAVAIEIIAGIFGFMGVGHMLAGRIVPGIALLVGWWVAIAFSWILILPLLLFTCGLGVCLLPFIWWGPPILSGLWLRSLMTARPMFSR